MSKGLDNVEATISGSILTIKIDLTKEFGASASGKSTIIASSRGNRELRDGLFYSINVYKK